MLTVFSVALLVTGGGLAAHTLSDLDSGTATHSRRHDVVLLAVCLVGLAVGIYLGA